ncbi:unnamed protein product, partial [Allacma fusca]
VGIPNIIIKNFPRQNMGSDDGKKQKDRNARITSTNSPTRTSRSSSQGVSITAGETTISGDVFARIERGGTAADISTTGRTQVDGSIVGMARVTNDEQGAHGVRVNTQGATFQSHTLMGIVSDDPSGAADEATKILNALRNKGLLT